MRRTPTTPDQVAIGSQWENHFTREVFMITSLDNLYAHALSLKNDKPSKIAKERLWLGNHFKLIATPKESRGLVTGLLTGII